MEQPRLTGWRRYVLVQPPALLLLTAMAMSGNKFITLSRISLAITIHDYVFLRRYDPNRHDSLSHLHRDARNK